MNLKFDCTAEDAGTLATYQRLLAQIERAAQFADPTGRRDRQSAAILRSGLFDADLYRSTYKDVVASGVDPLQHYIENGDDDGRWPNAFFDPVFYRRQFVVEGRWPFSALYHFVTMGEAAGLRPCAAFDPRRYRSANPTLDPGIDRPLVHFLWIGRHHGLSSTRKDRLAADRKIELVRRNLPAAVSPNGLRRAVNLIGPLDRVVGLGVSARGYFEGLTLAGFGPVGARAQKREFGLQSPVAGQARFADFIQDAAINIVHLNGDILPMMLRDGGASALAGRYNIAIWYWELPTLRPEWQGLMEHFHAFWAPSPFVAEALQQSTAKPVTVVPPYLSYLRSPPSNRPSSGGGAHFVYCFDANSGLERKNPGLLLDAFLIAFPPGSPARLTFKVTYPNRQLPELERLYAAAKEHSNIAVIDALVSDAELHDLISSATAYVSPHRSEGLGLTVIEAMAFGTPVIATPFGGLAPFITAENAWPIDYRLVELEEDHAPYPRGYVWAEPDLESLVGALQGVNDNPKGARVRADVARAKIVEIFASQEVLKIYLDALEHAATFIGI